MPLPATHLGPFDLSPTCNQSHLSKMEHSLMPLITQKQNLRGSHSPELGIQSLLGLSPAIPILLVSPHHHWPLTLALCPATVNPHTSPDTATVSTLHSFNSRA